MCAQSPLLMLLSLCIHVRIRTDSSMNLHVAQVCDVTPGVRPAVPSMKHLALLRQLFSVEAT